MKPAKELPIRSKGLDSIDSLNIVIESIESDPFGYFGYLVKLDTVILCSTSARGIQEARLIHPMTKGFVHSGKFDECTNATICSTSSNDFSMTMGNPLAGVISNPDPIKGSKVS